MFGIFLPPPKNRATRLKNLRAHHAFGLGPRSLGVTTILVSPCMCESRYPLSPQLEIYIMLEKNHHKPSAPLEELPGSQLPHTAKKGYTTFPTRLMGGPYEDMVCEQVAPCTILHVKTVSLAHPLPSPSSLSTFTIAVAVEGTWHHSARAQTTCNGVQQTRQWSRSTG